MGTLTLLSRAASKSWEWLYEDVPTGLVPVKLILCITSAVSPSRRITVCRYVDRWGWMPEQGDFPSLGMVSYDLSLGVRYQICKQEHDLFTYISITEDSPFEIIESDIESDSELACLDGNYKFGSTYKVLSQVSLLGQPGPRDRFERLLDFGVSGVDPEPDIKEVLDKVEAPPRKLRQNIPQPELMDILDKVR